MTEKMWFDSEEGILTYHRQQRDAEADRHAEAMVRIKKAETDFLDAFRKSRPAKLPKVPADFIQLQDHRGFTIGRNRNSQRFYGFKDGKQVTEMRATATDVAIAIDKLIDAEGNG
jgi:hypothetical protein